MVIKTKFTMGGVSYELHVDEKDEMDALHKSIALSNPRSYCAACKTATRPEDLHMTTNKDKEGNTYVSVKHKCGAKSKLGLFKSGGFFWHEFEVYVPKSPSAQTEVDKF